MANITSTTSKANSIINSIINVEASVHPNTVALAKIAGTTFLKLNGFTAGAIGGTEKEQKANIRCIQFIVDNCDKNESGIVLAQQAMMLTNVMADLEDVCLDDTLVLDRVEYIIDVNLKKVFAENGKEILSLDDLYPELSNVTLTSEAIRAILIGELNKHKIEPIAVHYDTSAPEGELNIESDKRLSVIDTIKGLKALGMTASWFNVNGIRQPMPICYNGDADLAEFTKVVKKCLDADKDWLEVCATSCRFKENSINPDDAIYNIEGIDCIIDYDNKTIWSEDGISKYASLDDIEYELPNEAVKVMLIERAKNAIEALNEEYEEEEEW